MASQAYGAGPTPRGLGSQILVASFAMLFLEVALVRWLSTEARIFAYVNNLVLLACFLGIGLGSYYSRRRIPLALGVLALVALIAMIRLPLLVPLGDRPVHLFRDAPLLLSPLSDLGVWYGPEAGGALLATALGLCSTFAILLAVALVFVPLGAIVGAGLDAHPDTIAAYSINVLASVFGAWSFSALSFVYAPPWVWFGAAGALLVGVMLTQPLRSATSVASLLVLAAAVCLLAWQGGREGEPLATLWSPYQKLEVVPEIHEPTGVKTGYRINVNNVGYMAMLDLSDAFVAAHPDLFRAGQRRRSQYDVPFALREGAARVLVLGAGAGNDVAGALRHGAQQVDAVEIDPGITRLGLRFHPEAPYRDPRVRVVVDDARSFLRRSTDRYDVIAFGLLDAHASASAYNNTRIDHYVYTLEAFQEARHRLADSGIISVAFEAQRPWIQRRLFDLLSQVFGFPPRMIHFGFGSTGWGGTLFLSAGDPETLDSAIRGAGRLGEFLGRRARPPGGPAVAPTSDDWPYLYLESRSIPSLHLWVSGILVTLVALGRRVVLGRGRLDLHFFFLGAAFLLLEFQNISKAALLFGSTWLVNALVITAILALVLLANLFASRIRVRDLRGVYVLLLASVAAIYFIPLEALGGFDFWTRALLGGFVLNLPVFFGGIVFIESFRSAPAKDAAFGSNLLGSVAGGLLESLSFVTGIHALLALVLLCYALAWTFAGRSRALAT